MKKSWLKILAATTSLALLTSVASAAEVEIDWQNPKEYRDVKAANGSDSRFRKQTFNKLEAYLRELAEALPEDQTLLVQVTDLDLAGQVWPASFVGLGHSASDVRLIKSIYLPRMTFSYQLQGADGQLLGSSEVKLKDMSFLDRANRFFRNDSLKYEKNMLKNWFDREFLREEQAI